MFRLQAELGGTSGEGAEADAPNSGGDNLNVDDTDMYLFTQKQAISDDSNVLVDEKLYLVDENLADKWQTFYGSEFVHNDPI